MIRSLLIVILPVVVLAFLNEQGREHKHEALRGLLQAPTIGGGSEDKVALLFVGHGEPRTFEDGDASIFLADGTPFGPHAASLGVPEAYQYTEWAAAYEEIATAMTYIFRDSNANGIQHEIAISPDGDVPDFFTWAAFRESVNASYHACNNYSPHVDALYEHVNSIQISLCGVNIDIYLAFLDAVPRIRDVVSGITERVIGVENGYNKIAVVPMLLSDSTHTQEIHDLVAESAHLTSEMGVLVTEPFFEVPYMRRRFQNAVIAMAKHIREAVPDDVPDHLVGVVLESHGTPYVPARPEFGWEEGEIFSDLIVTEDEFHKEISKRLPWESRTGRMQYAPPSVEEAIDSFDADGFTHVLVVATGFPTAAIHTMWDVGRSAIGRPVLPQEGVVSHSRASGMNVYYTSHGLADIEPGRSEFRKGLEFLGMSAVMEALKDNELQNDFFADKACPAGLVCVTVKSDEPISDELQLVFYTTTEAGWPPEFQELTQPIWEEMLSTPDRLPARLRIPVAIVSSQDAILDGARVGLMIAASGLFVQPTDPHGYSTKTIDSDTVDGWDFGTVNIAPPSGICPPGEICVTVTAQETTGPDLKLMLYLVTENEWPQQYRELPTPTWVVTETTPVPESFPVFIHMPIAGNLYGFTNDALEGAQLGLAVVTGVASNFIVDPTDARGFSAGTMLYESGVSLDFGNVELTVPKLLCERNPYNPACLTGPLLWKEHLLGEPDFVPGAIYMDYTDLNGDGIRDVVMVGEPHFENPELPLTVLKLGIYYLGAGFSVVDTEIIDEWSEGDQTLYSPWGVRVVDVGGEPVIIVGLNIPGLAPLEDGNGNVLSYRRVDGVWQRSVIVNNTDPTVTNYNAMIVVTSDIDNDGDQDIALGGAFKTSLLGSWLENTGNVDNPWIPHLQPMDPNTDPAMRGTLAYKSFDLNGDGYPEIMYNAMFDIPGTDPPRYRGEIWLAVNPGPSGWDEPWRKVVIDDDNWASADMWFHDFDGDDLPYLVANQIFDGTVTLYTNPGGELSDAWERHVIISGLASPSDMYLADVDEDGLIDVVSADHTAHQGVWHKNPGPDSNDEWQINLIFPNILLPGDFVVADADGDGDLDWVGTSVTLGQAFIVEQVHPQSSLVTTISLPKDFIGTISSLTLTLVGTLPITGPPDKILATVTNDDKDGDGIGDVDAILSPSRSLILATEDVEMNGDFFVMAVLYMEGGGTFQPMPGIDYMATSPKLTFGQGQVNAALELELLSLPS